jgi:hypothetical protein
MLGSEKRAALAAALTLALTGCGGAAGPEASAPAGADGAPRLLVLSSMIGYVEPCGCTIDLLLGGIDRIARVVEDERAQGPTAVLLVGPTLFEGAVEAHMKPQAEARTDLLSQSLGRIGVDGWVPTHDELALGRERYDALSGRIGAPDITANVAGGQGRILNLGGARVGVFGLADPEGGETPGGAPSDPAEAATATAAALRAEGAQVVVGLAALPRRALRRMSRQIEGVDLWVLGDHPAELAHASPAGSSFLIEAGDRGRHVGRIVLRDLDSGTSRLADPVGARARALKALDLRIDMQSETFARTRAPVLQQKIAALREERAELAAAPIDEQGRRFDYTLVPVPKEVEPDPKIREWVAGYNASLKALNLAAAGEVPPVPEGGSGYAGTAECVDCHDEAHQMWLTTPHAKAWQTLVDAGKTFDAECVSCHVSGWRQPGGAVLGKLDHLVNVGCESCHGPGQVHVDVGGDETSIERMAPEAVCVTCHNEHHSPKFDYATYLPRVLGPGHEARKD